jgi:adenosylcobinamide kinase / adenosylcobinamide-phosphate guanylyltransferase
MDASKKLIFITGGVRSGKSQFALELAQKFPDPKAYLATAQALDAEMTERIQKHKDNRPRNWRTLEEPRRVSEILKKEGGQFGLILLDCLTLWVSNLMMGDWSEAQILEEADRLIRMSRLVKGSLIIVSNEVGLGVVPDNPAARSFRDLCGWIHQRVAREADDVFFMIAGLPQKLKGN